MTKLHDLEDLVGVSDIADFAGVGKAAVSNWTERDLGFPEPLLVISKSIPIYSRLEVALWLVQTGRIEVWKPGAVVPPF